ncbi:rhomboid family intramembrane serine protease GlpG [Alkalimonas collagenimarina]|uniref:Rhomboid family intramembrane serine protease GlpG n=1 Tax=Alkalimonas collagenimarina TaxID=400390 RepID=A0ABT9GZ46_9GAMM|nr:rhomboid family intramembrane serine protease GlpG [Alkalimonas collagenimarina]MDP4536293.1 rhomboid family intramembrane serine protease GlpG [Alkalimonas collagenimarina]
MNKIGELNSVRAAMVFADYCVTRGWPVQAVPEPAMAEQPELAALYVEPDYEADVVAALQQFLQEPDHPRYRSAAWQRSQVAVSGPGQSVFSGLDARAFSGLVTILVLSACLLVYGWQQLAPQVAFGWLGSFTQPESISWLQSWRWITPAVLHFSLLHLVFNLMWWWFLAGQFERVLGRWQLISFTLSCALLSNVAQYLLVGPYFGGLSGVVYALFGYFWWAGRLNPSQGLQLSPGLVGFMLIWMLLGFLDVLWIQMANWAHLAGLLAGCSWAWLLRHKQPRQH